MSDQPSHCPHCNADFQGEPIPEADREAYGGGTHFSRVIGVYDTELDCTTHWRCPDCGKDIPRPGWERFAAEPGWETRIVETAHAMAEKIRKGKQ